MNEKIKVLIVDDSAVVRKILSEALSKDRDIEVVGTAVDPYVARDKIVLLKPDVITLDIEMPRMDGLTFLNKLMTFYPMPVVIVSSLTQEGCATTLKALEYGAVDVVAKPGVGVTQTLGEIGMVLTERIKAAAQVKFDRHSRVATDRSQPRPTLVMPSAMIETTDKIIAIGASTGGTEALKEILMRMPKDSPGMLIVQHMPEKFTAAFAERLNTLCEIEVHEAKPNDSIRPGLALIAPGDYHLMLRRSGARYYADVRQGPLVSRHRPSVDVLFNSVAKYAGANAVGVILTGMGADGSQGMLNMKKSGAYNIAQDEQSCVVYGMPKEAVKLGAVDRTVHLSNIPEAILSGLSAISNKK